MYDEQHSNAQYQMLHGHQQRIVVVYHLRSLQLQSITIPMGDVKKWTLELLAFDE